MRFFWLTPFIITSYLFAEQIIINDTDKPMLCEANYRATFSQEKLHGILQNIKTQEQKQVVKIIPAHGNFKRAGKGIIKCYNQKMKLEAYNEFSIKQTNRYTLTPFLARHEMFDISSYTNENRAFVDSKYGISRRCEPYKGGKYCYKANGLDILFNAKGRVTKLFIYGPALQNGTLPLEAKSIAKIRSNYELLGLWVSQKNKKLLRKKPNIVSTNTLIWNNPAPYIKRIIMTSKEGHLGRNRYAFRYVKTDKSAKLYSKLGAIEVDYKLDDKAYEKWQKTHPTPFVSSKKAGETWGKYLNPKHLLPKNKFYVAYINTTKPKQIIATQIVDKIAMHYAYDKFHGIASKDFGAYWVGKLSFAKTTKRIFNVSQSWAKTRIIVDNIVIYEGGRTAQIPYTFTKGAHRVEVEYINNWHTTNFTVVISAQKDYYNARTLPLKLKKIISKSSHLLYCGVYESRNQDQSITVKLKKEHAPVVLVLNSYRGVEWKISNPHHLKIEAIIYSAYKLSAEVKGVKKSVPILAYKGNIGSYSMQQKCRCTNSAFFHCEGSNGLKNLNRIEMLLHKKVYGFSVIYGAKSMNLPDTLVTKNWRQEQRKQEQVNALARKACQKQSNPSFETMFQKR